MDVLGKSTPDIMNGTASLPGVEDKKKKRKPPPRSPGSQKKISQVMREFKAGKLKSSSGQKVTNPRQAMAIAIAESRRAGKKKPEKKGKKK